MKNLLPAVRRQKHKSKRTHARTSLQLWMWLVDLNFNFECDWPIELSDNKLSNNKVKLKSLFEEINKAIIIIIIIKVSNNKLSDNNLASELVEK